MTRHNVNIHRHNIQFLLLPKVHYNRVRLYVIEINLMNSLIVLKSICYPILSVPIKTEDDVVYEDNTQCHFNLKNFKILYIINSENCFYRRFALRRAITVNDTKKLKL